MITKAAAARVLCFGQSQTIENDMKSCLDIKTLSIELCHIAYIFTAVVGAETSVVE